MYDGQRSSTTITPALSARPAAPSAGVARTSARRRRGPTNGSRPSASALLMPAASMQTIQRYAEPGRTSARHRSRNGANQEQIVEHRCSPYLKALG